MNYLPLSALEEQIGKAVVHAAYRVHKELGPGLLERVYEVCMAYELKKAGFLVERQVIVPVIYDDLEFDEGFRTDLFVQKRVIAEIKSVETIHPVWPFQVLSHLRLTELRLGYIINFNVVLIKDGIRRFIR